MEGARVVTFMPKPKDPEPPKSGSLVEGHNWLTGPATCLACEHKFIAVAPVGEAFIECPSCGTKKATFSEAFYPAQDTNIRFCNCGNHLFILTEIGHLCPMCGTYQRY